VSLNQVDDAIGDAARLGVQQDALVTMQLADHEKFLPPMRLDARKACPGSDQSVDGIKISLQVIKLTANCGLYFSAARFLLFGETKEISSRRSTIISWAVFAKI
jgi:hypothetical protein